MELERELKVTMHAHVGILESQGESMPSKGYVYVQTFNGLYSHKYLEVVSCISCKMLYVCT